MNRGSNILYRLMFLILLVSSVLPAFGENLLLLPDEKKIPKFQNPISVQYLKTNLLKTHPRLVLNTDLEKLLKLKLKSDPVIQNIYKTIRRNAEEILQKPLLERKLEGIRLLDVSREMLYRINMLGMVYRIEKDAKILDRINQEVVAVCNFADWNPSHYLDVAEMSMAVAIALDWTAGNLPTSTIQLARTALIEKGIKPSWPENGKPPAWAFGTNNWNLVCNSGMIAASIAIAEEDTELAAKTIHRAIEGMAYAIAEYGPDGVYPEGPTYWVYGTGFLVMTVAMLESAFGTDFGIANYPAFQNTAVYRALINTPSGGYYNFSESDDKRSQAGDLILAWFASKTGNKTFFEKERFLAQTENLGELSRISAAALVWISQYNQQSEINMPTAWKGEGDNPIVIFTGGDKDTRGYYFAGKGGRATTSHGQMDAGSFIFELDGIRWSIDPGNQSYHPIEQAGFDLWGNCQKCQRWTLLTKNNYGHSTITVNRALFINNGYAPLKKFKAGSKPEATFDLTAVYGKNLTNVARRFVKENNSSIMIEDHFNPTSSTREIVWQMMTAADVEIVKSGAILRQDGKELKLDNLENPELQVSVIQLDPPPFYLDRKVAGLKRLEIRMPAYLLKSGAGKFKVRLSGK